MQLPSVQVGQASSASLVETSAIKKKCSLILVHGLWAASLLHLHGSSGERDLECAAKTIFFPSKSPCLSPFLLLV